MKQCLRRLLTVGVSFAAALLMLTAAAFATSGAHFFNVGSSVNDAGALVVSYDEAGVGNATVNYTIDITNASAVYACINGGGNHPKAANKETVSSGLTVGFSRDPVNARVSHALTNGWRAGRQAWPPRGAAPLGGHASKWRLANEAGVRPSDGAPRDLRAATFGGLARPRRRRHVPRPRLGPTSPRSTPRTLCPTPATLRPRRPLARGGACHPRASSSGLRRATTVTHGP